MDSENNKQITMAAIEAMRKEKATKYFNRILSAINEVRFGKQLVAATATKYALDSYVLDIFVKKFDMTFPATKPMNQAKAMTLIERMASFLFVFNEEQESILVQYVKRVGRITNSLNPTTIRQLAYQYAKKAGIEFPPAWDDEEMATRQWYYIFAMRHPVWGERNLKRMQKIRDRGFCMENVSYYFFNIQKARAEHHYGTSGIWNMDVMGFSTVRKQFGKLVSVKGQTRIDINDAGESGEMITMAFAINAAGEWIPPFYVFPKKKMQQSYLEYAVKETVGYANETGCIRRDEFFQFIKHFIRFTQSTRNTPTLLLMPTHTIHLCLEILDFAEENGVSLVSFPKGCTLQLQPFDISVYEPVKKVYVQQRRSWLIQNEGRRIKTKHIPLLAKISLLAAATPEGIINSFKTTGIIPFNSKVFTDIDYQYIEKYGYKRSGSQKSKKIKVEIKEEEPDIDENVSSSTEDEDDVEDTNVNKSPNAEVKTEPVATANPSTEPSLNAVKDTENVVLQREYYKCHFCPVNFIMENSYYNHVMTHLQIDQDASFQCNICAIIVPCRTTLNRHMVLHSKYSDFFCEECGKTFAQRNLLHRHMETHPGLIHCGCQQCTRSLIKRVRPHALHS